MDVRLDEKSRKMTIVIDIAETISTSGKSIVIASTFGNKQTSTKYKGQPVTVGLNAYVKNPNYTPPKD